MFHPAPGEPPAPWPGRSRAVPSSFPSPLIPFSLAAGINSAGTKRCRPRLPRPLAASPAGMPAPGLRRQPHRRRGAAPEAEAGHAARTPVPSRQRPTGEWRQPTHAGHRSRGGDPASASPVPPAAGTCQASAMLPPTTTAGSHRSRLPHSAGAGHRAMSRRPLGRDTRHREPKPQSSAPAPGEGSKAPSPSFRRAEAQTAPRLPPHSKTPEPPPPG